MTELTDKEVLVIDDDIVTQKAVERLFRKDGKPNLTCTDNATDAILALKSRTFDLIICDLLLPDLDGLALAQEIRRAGPNQATPLVLCTGASRSDLEDDPAIQDMNIVFGYKPITTGQLAEAMEKSPQEAVNGPER